MKVNILGTEYQIHYRSINDDERLNDCDGYCDWTTKTIVVEKEIEGATLGNMEVYMKKVLRHEITHAFLLESGLDVNANETDAWARNEEMVDWIARQGLKLYKAWKEAGAI